jgi:predicted flap endonuclease-1-like 5' DNA nuclease
MFNNDVTKNYEMIDATFEILIMLAGAFLLGALFSWALSKLRSNKQNRRHSYRRKTVDQQNGFRQPVQHAGANYPDNFDTGNIVKKASAATIIGGSATAIGSGMANGASNRLVSTGSAVTESLADTRSSLKKNASDAISSADDTLSEAGSATLDNASDKVSGTKSALSGTAGEAIETADDFKKIEGIDSQIETTLHTAGVKTYADLRASDSNTLKAILNAASPTFNMHDPETWPYQADLAYNNKWEKLKEYQDFLMGREE